MDQFNDTTLEQLFPDLKSQHALKALYNQRLITLPPLQRPRKVMVYSSCRLRAGLFARSTHSFRGQARHDYVSLTEDVPKKANQIVELGCLCALYYPNVVMPTNVAVVLHYDDVRTLKNYADSTPDAVLAHKINTIYSPVFERIQCLQSLPVGEPFLNPLTDGRLLLGRRYITERPRNLGVGNPSFSVLPVQRLFKPEHILRDLKLYDNKDIVVKAYYVQNTRTYYSNLSLSL